tara:strand:+ start:1005 stop:2873 length:1869 start_codon:yes stop_codon:yes gene_type:complete
MCGIAAIFGPKDSKKNNLEKMISSIAHRGPDNIGFLHTKNISLGSCRLSIFDFSENGNMPMSDKSGRYKIIYNGEIYNFKELKKRYNISTKSNTDTEILLELFSKFKLECLNYLNGIFAFIIFDSLENKVYCVRDRFGVKPLYYTNIGDTFYFCSEIKGIIKVFENVKINYDAVKMYLSTSFYDFSNKTFYEKIYQVTQSTCIIFDLNNLEKKEIRYWDLSNDSNKEKKDRSFDSLNKHFSSSLLMQQRSDTKIGLNVSTGLDSNLMISYLNLLNGGQKNISANSYYFADKEFDHRKNLREMSKFYGWSINEFEIKSNDVIEKFESVFKSQDEPYPGIVTIAKDILIEKAYPKDCKVILEGQGGDEMAAGYKYVYPMFILDLLKNFKFIKVFKEIKDFSNEEGVNFGNFLEFFNNSVKGYFFGGISADGTRSYDDSFFKIDFKKNKSAYKEIISKIKKNQSYLKKILYRDIFFCKLSRILRSCDRASMAHGKELRVPFLDHNLVDYFFSTEDHLLLGNGRLRNHYKNFASYKFPDNKFLKKIKIYHSDPQTKWLKTSLFDWMYDQLSSKNLVIDNLIDKNKLLVYLNNFKNNEKLNNSNLLWQLINLEYLFKKNKLESNHYL